MVHAELVCPLELLCEREVGGVGRVNADGGGTGGGQKSGFGGGEGEDVGWMGVVNCVEGQVLFRHFGGRVGIGAMERNEECRLDHRSGRDMTGPDPSREL